MISEGISTCQGFLSKLKCFNGISNMYNIICDKKGQPEVKLFLGSDLKTWRTNLVGAYEVADSASASKIAKWRRGRNIRIIKTITSKEVEKRNEYLQSIY